MRGLCVSPPTKPGVERGRMGKGFCSFSLKSLRLSFPFPLKKEPVRNAAKVRLYPESAPRSTLGAFFLGRPQIEPPRNPVFFLFSSAQVRIWRVLSNLHTPCVNCADPPLFSVPPPYEDKRKILHFPRVAF